MLTCAQLVSMAMPLMGGASATLPTPVGIVNLAGEYLTGMHDWEWRLRPSVILGTTQSQSYIALPSDFSEMMGLSPAPGVLTPVRFTTMAHMVQLRSVTLSGSVLGYWVALSNSGQATASGDQAARRLELFPTPAGTVASALALTYRAKWTELDETLPASKPNMPDFMQTAMILAVQAHAAGLRNGDLSARLADLEASSTLSAAIREDSQTKLTDGEVRGGWMEQLQYVSPYAAAVPTVTTINP